MDFSAFDKSKMEEYARRAKEEWGNSPEYQEYAERSKNRTGAEEQRMAGQFMMLFAEAGEMKDSDPASAEAQDLVKRIQQFISDNMYTCSNEILSGLGQMYSAGGEFTQNIDKAGGPGTAEFVSEAIAVYCN